MSSANRSSVIFLPPMLTFSSCPPEYDPFEKNAVEDG